MTQHELLQKLNGHNGAQLSGRVLTHCIAVYMRREHLEPTDLSIDPVKLWNMSVITPDGDSYKTLQLLEVAGKAITYLSLPSTLLSRSEITFIASAWDTMNTNTKPIKLSDLVKPRQQESNNANTEPYDDPYNDEEDEDEEEPLDEEEDAEELDVEDDSFDNGSVPDEVVVNREDEKHPPYNAEWMPQIDMENIKHKLENLRQEPAKKRISPRRETYFSNK